jgi:hypothetical protein
MRETDEIDGKSAIGRAELVRLVWHAHIEHERRADLVHPEQT